MKQPGCLEKEGTGLYNPKTGFFVLGMQGPDDPIPATDRSTMNEDSRFVFEMTKTFNARKYWIRVPFKHWLIAKIQFKESRLKFRSPK